MLAHTNRFQWRAEYSDGTSLQQIDASDNKHSYDDIDKERLSSFDMYEGNVRVLSLRFKSGQKLIWRRRVEITPSGGVSEVIHIIGKQETVNGKTYQGIVGLFESDGRIEVAGKFEEEHPWFYPPQLHEGEEWEG